MYNVNVIYMKYFIVYYTLYIVCIPYFFLVPAEHMFILIPLKSEENSTGFYFYLLLM